MTPQYTYGSSGNPIGVFIPFNDWNSITERYFGIEDVPEWEKNLIDQRLDFIKDLIAGCRTKERQDIS